MRRVRRRWDCFETFAQILPIVIAGACAVPRQYVPIDASLDETVDGPALDLADSGGHGGSTLVGGAEGSILAGGGVGGSAGVGGGAGTANGAPGGSGGNPAAAGGAGGGLSGIAGAGGATCKGPGECCANTDCAGPCQVCGLDNRCSTVVDKDDPTGRCAGTCDAAGACKSKFGQVCQATTGGCVPGLMCSPEGLCCDSACTGACQACDVSGSVGKCVAVGSGPAHSGHACGGTCSTGLCCPQGQANCDGNCVDLSSDGNHCGTCAKTCTRGQLCQGGGCKSSNGQACSTATECVSGTCTIYWRDKDQDTYGDTHNVIGLCGTSAQNQAPAGYVLSGGQIDCCDDDGGNQTLAAKIHPGADFQTTSAGGVCGITWDFNCNGGIDLGPEYSGRNTCDDTVCATIPFNQSPHAPDFCGKTLQNGGCAPTGDPPPAPACNGSGATMPGQFSCR